MSSTQGKCEICGVFVYGLPTLQTCTQCTPIFNDVRKKKCEAYASQDLTILHCGKCDEYTKVNKSLSLRVELFITRFQLLERELIYASDKVKELDLQVDELRREKALAVTSAGRGTQQSRTYSTPPAYETGFC